MAAKEPAKPSQRFQMGAEQRVKAKLITEHNSIQPGGKTRVGVFFEMEQGWHIYAKDPGDAGLPTKVTWKAPPAVSFGPLIWPPAERFLDSGNIKTFGYRNSVLLSSHITYKPLLNPNNEYENLPIWAHVEWLACKEICLPGSADLEMSLPVTMESSTTSPHAKLFE